MAVKTRAGWLDLQSIFYSTYFPSIKLLLTAPFQSPAWISPFLKLPERGRTKYVSCSNLEGADGRGYKRWVFLLRHQLKPRINGHFRINIDPDLSPNLY